MIGAAWLLCRQQCLPCDRGAQELCLAAFEAGWSAFPERKEYMWCRAAFLAGGSSQERAWHAAGKEQMRDKNVGDQVLPGAAKESKRSKSTSLLAVAHNKSGVGEKSFRLRVGTECLPVGVCVPSPTSNGSYAGWAPSVTLCPTAASPKMGTVSDLVSSGSKSQDGHRQ